MFKTGFFTNALQWEKTYTYLMPLFIALSLSVTQYYFSKNACEKGDVIAKYKTFTTVSYEYSSYTNFITPVQQSRLFSNLVASLFVKVKTSTEDTYARFIRQVSFYNAFWLFAVFLLCIFLVKNQLFWIFGIFASACYAWTPAAEYRIYPWDGPALFFWTLLVLCSRPRFKDILPFILMIGTGFKETVMLGFLIPLFWFEMPKRERIARCAIYLAACVMMKVTVVMLSRGLLPFYLIGAGAIAGQSVHHGLPKDFMNNIHAIFSWKLNHPVFINGGTLLATFLLPNIKNIVMFKVLALLYIIVMLFFGGICEFRIWHEMIPVFLYCFSLIMSENGRLAKPDEPLKFKRF
jgi:hypothetical protein